MAHLHIYKDNNIRAIDFLLLLWCNYMHVINTFLCCDKWTGMIQTQLYTNIQQASTIRCFASTFLFV